jgi:PEP-CTERM putative exosortase interaction domain
MKLETTLALVISVGFAMSSYGNVLVNDNWSDATRTDPNSAATPPYAENNGVTGTDADSDGTLESAWFKSGTGSSVTATAGHLTASGGATSSMSLETYFTPEATPLTLGNVGDQLKLTWVFTPTGVNSSDVGQNFRLAIVDSPSASRVTSDATPGSSTYSGYGLFFNMATTIGGSTPFNLLGRVAPATSSALLSASGSWTALQNGTAVAGQTGFASGTEYTFVFSATRNASSGLDLSATITGGSIGNTGGITNLFTDTTPNGGSFSFDTLALRPATPESTATSFDTTRFEAEFIPVPEPSTLALVGLGMVAFAGYRRMRR